MKTNAQNISRKIFILFSFFYFLNTNAQTPNKFSYQAVVRNATNNLVSNHTVGIKISLLEGSAVGPTQYIETQTTTTNSNGLVSIIIGNGTIVSGSIATALWDQATYFLKTEIDPTGGSNYTITNTSQLLSVPYALNSKTSEKTKAVYGDAGYIPVFDSTGEVLVNSSIFKSNTGKIGINNSTPNYGFDAIAEGVEFKSNGDDQFIDINSNYRNFLAFSNGARKWAIFNNRTWNGSLTFFSDYVGRDVLSIGMEGTTRAETLQIGNHGAPLARYEMGSVAVGSSTSQKKTVTLTFYYPFITDTNYRVNVTPINEGTFTDVFAVSISNKTLNSCDVTIYRLDSATGWGQNLTLDYSVKAMND